MIANLVQQKSISTGTGDMTLTDVSGRQGFYQAFGTGGSDVFFYFISHTTADEWEVGTGHLSDATTLVRDTIITSSTGTRIDFSAGYKDVVNDVPADHQIISPVIISNIAGLQTALDDKLDKNSTIAGATKTKITYDANGLVISGTEATTADIADSADKRYVTDAQLTSIDNANRADRTIRQWISNAGVTAVNLGLTLSFTGGTSLPSNALTNYFTSQNKTWLNVSVTANTTAGGRHSGLLVNRGAGNGSGGFYWSFKGGGDDAAPVANARNFCGMSSTNAFFSNVNPSTLFDLIGFGWDSGDANMQFIHNDSAGAATKIDLGAGFPANTNAADWYQHEIWCAPSTSIVFYKLTRWTAAGTKTSVSGSVTTNLPTAGNFMSPQIFAGNGTTTLARRYGMGSMYLETYN